MLNIGYKNDLIHLKVYVLRAWHTANLFQSLLIWLTATDEIRVLAFDIHLICSEYVLKHDAPNQEICVFTLGLLSICIEYGLLTWIANRDEIIVLQCVRVYGTVI